MTRYTMMFAACAMLRAGAMNFGIEKAAKEKALRYDLRFDFTDRGGVQLAMPMISRLSSLLHTDDAAQATP